MTLDALMIAAGTDKSSEGHGYAPSYKKFLATFGDVITILEIGAAQGASLKVWKEYLPHAKVYGIDSNPDSLYGFIADGVFIGNQTDADFCLSVIEEIGSPDVVIDDGGHLASEQITSFQILFPSVASGGLYVVEDTHAWYSEGYQDMDALGFFTDLVDAVNVQGRGGIGNYEKAIAWGDGSPIPHWSQYVSSLQFFQSLLGIWRR